MKKRTNQRIFFAIAAAVLVAAALLIVLNLSQTPASKPSQTEQKPEQTEKAASETELPTAQSEQTEPADSQTFEPISLGNGIEVVKLSSYAGLFVEDGSDAIVSDVLQATVENTGTDNVQYMRFFLLQEDGTSYEFELTTLLAGEKMTVLEKNRTQIPQNISITAQIVEDYAVLSEAPSLHSEVFALQSQDHTVSVTNISDRPVSAGRIFYKNYMSDTYIGGITYMLSFTDLEPGETVQLSSAHYFADSSRIVFVTYAEQ